MITYSVSVYDPAMLVVFSGGQESAIVCRTLEHRHAARLEYARIKAEFSPDFRIVLTANKGSRTRILAEYKP